MQLQPRVWHAVPVRRWKWVCGALALPWLVALLAVTALAQSLSLENTAASTSCSLLGIAADSQSLNPDVLLSAYNAQAERVHSLQASVIVRGQSGAEYNVHPRGAQALPALLSFLAPDFLRLTGEIPFSGRRSFDLASDGRELRLLVPDGKFMRFLFGPVDAPATSKNPRENLRPRPLVDALHWVAATLSPPIQSSGNEQGSHHSIAVNLAAGANGPTRRARLEFDLQTGTVAQLSIFNASSQIDSETEYSDWRTVTDGGNAATPVCYPRRIVLTLARQDLHLELKIVSIRLNAQLARLQFRLVPPRGILVTRLNSGGVH